MQRRTSVFWSLLGVVALGCADGAGPKSLPVGDAEGLLSDGGPVGGAADPLPDAFEAPQPVPDGLRVAPDAAGQPADASGPVADARLATVDAAAIQPDSGSSPDDAVAPRPDGRSVPADAAHAVPDASPQVSDAATVHPDAAPPAADAAAPSPDAAPPGPDAAAGPRTARSCFDAQFVARLDIGPDYDQFSPIVASHCLGTNHQDVQNVERVVFVGDSVTVGTPPTAPADYYRNLLAASLAQRFGLQAPDWLWQNVDLINGVSLIRESGDFASCAKWGARTDDLLQDNSQLVDCLPEDKRHLRTLVVLTMGGNDLSSLTQAAIDGRDPAALQAQTEDFVLRLREAVQWVKEPGRFPNGAFVIFGNQYEFTDGTGDTSVCPAAGLAGFGGEIPNFEAVRDLVVWANEQFLSIAVDTGSDMIFMLENFCGHGYNAGNPEAPCYRGPNMENWFDLTCIHPTSTGHRQIADMFQALVDE